MEGDSEKKNGTFGGKTVGTAGGGIFLILCNGYISTPQIKEIAIYASPFVAVWCKEWGGLFAYSIRLWVVQEIQDYKLKRLKKRIDGMPNEPAADAFKKEVNDKYYRVSTDIIHAGLADVERLGKFAFPKDRKDDG